MEDNIEFIKTYFTEEKIESLIFIFIGILSICLAFVFLFIIKYSFYKGLAYPLIIIGIIQLTVGTIIFNRSDADMKLIENYCLKEKEQVLKKELPRMEIVMKNFSFYKWIEIVLFGLGIFLFFFLRSHVSVFWKGLGLGLLIQASIMLSMDIVAEKRGQTYIEALKTINI